MKRGDRDAIEAAYDAVPKIFCKGLCASACGPIGYSAAEADRMREDGALPPTIRQHPKHGKHDGCGDGIMCSQLTDDDRCAIYENRPMVCRLWGAVKRLKCPHGCKPARGFLTDEQAWGLLAAVEDGRPPQRALPNGVGMRLDE